MLNEIKAIWTVRKIFEFINEGRKYELIIDNKNLQNQLNIKFRKYKINRNYYIIGEINGYCQEYDCETDALIFEGDYLNGKRNGKGKEYYKKFIYLYCQYNFLSDKNILKFDGEYLNGKRNGKGKEYDKDGNLVFDGEFLDDKKWKGIEYIYEMNRSGWDKLVYKWEYLNGKKWNGIGYDKNYNFELKEGKGYIKEFDFQNRDDSGYLKFEGEYLNGERNGKGKEYYTKDLEEIILKFEGEYLNGERNGKGKEYYKNENLKFEGDYKMGKEWNGKGYDKKNNIIYELKDGKGFIKNRNYVGEYLNGEKNGKGKEYDDYGKLIFEGEYLNGNRHGKGKEYCHGKLIFEGEYLKGERLKGKEYDNDKLIFEGEYNQHLKKGKEYFRNGKLQFEGEYLFNRKWNGTGYDPDGNQVYKLKNGHGTMAEYEYNWPDKIRLIYEGEYLYGKRNGYGKEYYENSRGIIYKYKGTFLNGKKHGHGIEIKEESQIIKFEGEYLNGERNGKGKEYDNSGKLIFEGEYLNNKKWNGKGKEFFRDSECVLYEGEFLNGQRWNGKGIEFIFLPCCEVCVYRNDRYIIEYLNGKKINVNKIIENNTISKIKDGKGALEVTDFDHLSYESEYLNGEKNGKGKEENYFGILFEGEYLDGKRWNGKGKEFRIKNWTQNVIFEGNNYINNYIKKEARFNNYENNLVHSNLIFEGEYLNGKKWNGKVKDYDDNGLVIFRGNYINGKKIEESPHH